MPVVAFEYVVALPPATENGSITPDIPLEICKLFTLLMLFPPILSEPLIRRDEVFNAKLLRIWKRPVPTTSNVVAGLAVPIPTFDVLPCM
jgi:hypothetical protein